MTARFTGDTSEPGVRALESLREVWVLLFGVGVGLILVGGLAIGSSFVATFATMVVFGILLLLGAIFQVVNAFWARLWGASFSTCSPASFISLPVCS